MYTTRFVELHCLHSYVGALLNRDDNGLAKRLSFGGHSRIRISSQCLKRHWLNTDDVHSLMNLPGAVEAYRSRDTVERMIMQGLTETGMTEEVMFAIGEALNANLYTKEGASDRRKRQALLLGQPEVNYLREHAARIAMDHPDNPAAAAKAVDDMFSLRQGEGSNFRAWRQQADVPAGLKGALCGRLITSDPAANIDSSMSVSHAFTTHREESESDYFSVVDDLSRDDEAGSAALLSDTELTSGIYYTYVVVNVPGLVSNLEGCDDSEWLDYDRKMASAVLHSLMYLIARITPGAKKGSTSPFSRARLMLLQLGEDQPYSLAEAFRKPTEPTFESASGALRAEMEKQDACYGPGGARAFMSTDDCELPGARRMSHGKLADWLQDAVLAGVVE